MIYVGIDLGKDGGLVVLDQDGKVKSKYKTPLVHSAKVKDEYDIPGMAGVLALIAPDVAIIEKGQPMPMAMGGTQANFQRGYSFGLWQGILVSLKISYDVVPPQTWQRRMLAGVRADDTKHAALIVAKRLWPGEDWRRSEKCKKADEGFVDAALIGEFGRRMRTGASNQEKSNSSS